MASQLQGRGTIAVLGVLAAAVVVVLLGVLVWQTNQPSAPPPAPESAAPPAPSPAPAPQAQTQPSAPTPVPPPPAGQAQAPAAPPATSPQSQAAAPASPPAPAAAAPPPAPAAGAPPPAPQPPRDAGPVPSFDVVRVEPTGDSVIAGRGASGATIEMLRDGQVHARGVADQSGLFALVPPPLPPGSHQIVLQSIAPDGTRQRSKESVTVVISEGRNTRPLVTLTAPDKPTVVLSNPEPPEQRTAQAPSTPAPAPPAQPQQQARAPQQPAQTPPPPAPAAPRAPVKIVTVEAEEGGRLFVSGEAAPGATVRLYLNDTMIAPGGVGGDGKVSFAIGRGVRPGDYRIRLDDVDPVSGAVKSRAEVPFNVPEAVAVPLPPPVPPFTGQGEQVAAAPPPPAGATQPGSPAQIASVPSPPAAVAPTTPGPAPRPQGSSPAAAPPGPSGQSASAPSGQSVGGAAQREMQIGTIVVPDVNTTIVSRGDNLWRISHRIYGRGLRYTVIYGANQAQIRNPNLIYPGQVFVLPGEQEVKAQ